IRADDRLARIVPIAEPPRRTPRRILADQADAVTAPKILERGRAVAAEIARVAPQLTILVEVGGREDIDLERLDAFRRLAGPRRADEAVLRAARIVADPSHRRARELELVQIGNQRSAAADALEARIRDLLSAGQRAHQRHRRQRGHAKCAVLHNLSPRYFSAARARPIA